MPEVSEVEYREKERQREAYLRDKAICESKISNLDEEITELDNAIRQMTDAYRSYKEQAKTLESLMRPNDQFKGKKYDSLINGDGMSLSNQAQRLQTNSVNSVLDQLEWLRAEKRRERNRQWGILGDIMSGIQYIGTWCQTHWFNN